MAQTDVDTRVIYCGDNADVLRKMPERCVDLIYIDPPFFSGRDYEVIWKEDWERRAFDDRHDSIADYKRFMEERCVLLHRVLKSTGTFYIHCDWHASHYLKVMLDSIFGPNAFLNEVVWRRHFSHNDPRKFGCIHDVLLVYVKGDEYTWNTQRVKHSERYIASHYGKKEGGRAVQLVSCSAPGDGPSRVFGDKGVMAPPKGRHWSWDQAGVDRLLAEKRIVFTRTGRPRLKQYLDESKGVPLQDIWDDIPPVNSQSKAAVGFPTQKPLALLERVIKTSSNPGDIVLDAFCGCGTTLEAAESLGRAWIGIDFSPTACRVMAKRLEKRCKIKQSEALWHADVGFIVRGEPTTVESLEEMDPFEFQNWAIRALSGLPNEKKVGDYGIDGKLYPASAIMGAGKGASGEQLEFTLDNFHPIQAKQVHRMGRPDIDKFETAMRRIDAHKGICVAFGYSRDSIREAARFERHEGRIIKLVTVQEILKDMEQVRSKALLGG